MKQSISWVRWSEWTSQWVGAVRKLWAFGLEWVAWCMVVDLVQTRAQASGFLLHNVLCSIFIFWSTRDHCVKTVSHSFEARVNAWKRWHLMYCGLISWTWYQVLAQRTLKSSRACLATSCLILVINSATRQWTHHVCSWETTCRRRPWSVDVVVAACSIRRCRRWPPPSWPTAWRPRVTPAVFLGRPSRWSLIPPHGAWRVIRL